MNPQKNTSKNGYIQERLQNHALREAYKASVINNMKTAEEHMEDTNTPEKVWHNIVETCQTYGK